MAKTFEEKLNSSKKRLEANSQSFDDKLERAQLKRSIGLDTLQTDYNTLTNLINKGNSWKNQDYMTGTGKDLQSLTKRFTDYQTYMNKYGGGSNSDIDNVVSYLNNANKSWSDMTSLYGYYNSAEAFENALNKKPEQTEYEKMYDMFAQSDNIEDLAERGRKSVEGRGNAFNRKYGLDKLDEYDSMDKEIAYAVMGQYGYGSEEFKNFLSDMNISKSKSEYDKVAEGYADLIKDNNAVKALAVASPLAQILLNPAIAVQKAGSEIAGKEFNPYEGAAGISNLINEGNEEISREITEATPNAEIYGVNVPAFLYNSVYVSGIQSKLGAAQFGPLYTPLMGANAYNSSYKEGLERGLDKNHAEATAIASGIAEALFEYISADKFVNMKSPGSGKDIIENVLKQFGIEGSEELNTDLANWATDTLINGKNSEFNQNIKQYIERGYSEEEARKMAFQDMGSQLIQSFIGGGLTGGISAFGSSVKQYNTNANVGVYADKTDFVNAMKDYDTTSEAYREYLGLTNKYGEDLSGAKSKGDYAKIGANISNAYSEAESKGYKETSKQISDAVTRESSKSKGRQIYESLNIGDNTVDYKGKQIHITDVYEEDNTLKVKTDEGDTLVASDVTFSDDMAKIVATAIDLSSLEEAKALLDNYDGQNAEDYIKEFKTAWEGAENNKSINNLSDKGKLIYASSLENTSKEVKDLIKTNDELIKQSEGITRKGNFDTSEIDYKSLNRTQKIYAETFRAISQITGMNIKLTNELSTIETGAVKNGEYDYETNTVTINLSAKYSVREGFSRGYIMSTAAHEFTHWMKAQVGAEEFSKLQTAIKEALGEEKWNKLVSDELAKLSEDDENRNETAEEEVVARACEDMLNDFQFAKRITENLDENESSKLKSAIKAFFDKVINALGKMLNNFRSQSDASRAIREIQSEYEKIQKQYLDMFDKAVKVSQSGDIALNNKYDVVNENTVMLSEQTYKNGGREFMENFLDSQIKKGELTAEDKNDIMFQLDWAQGLSKSFSINPNYVDYAEWQKTDAIKDSFGEWITAIVSNGDYDYNIDFATVCKKRKALDKVLNELVKSGIFDEYMPSGECLTEIINEIKANGFEVACALCFVDAKRYRVGSWATNYLEGFTDDNKKYNIGYNEMVREMAKLEGVKTKRFDFLKRDLLNLRDQGTTLDKLELNENSKAIKYLKDIIKNSKEGTNNYTKAMALLEKPELRKILNPNEIISSAGLDALRAQQTDLFDLVKASSGSATPKLSLSEVAYANEVAKDFNKKSKEQQKAMRDALRKVGGYRVQSFSDYMGNMVLDYVQLVSNFAGCKFPSHAYTKEYHFVKLFGMTGMKINMSVVPDSVSPELKEKFKEITKDESKLKNKKFDDVREEYLYYKAHSGMTLATKEDYDYYDSEDGSYWKYIMMDESFPFEKAMEIQADPRYNKNCGIIWVGVSKHHILSLLRNDNVPMVIPYHKSNINPTIAHLRGIAMYNDYTSVQSEKIWVDDGKGGKKLVNLSKSSNKALYNKLHNEFNFYDALNEAEKEWREGSDRSIPQMAADKYLAFCKDNGIVPKFSEFAEEDGYYKLLEDFRLYDGDGNYAPQTAVTMTFPDDFGKIVKESLDETAKTSNDMREKQDALIKSTKAIVEKYKSGVKNSSQLENPGININDSTQPFTDEILDGLKTIETRPSNSLDPYIGKRVGIVRTGKGKAMVVGYVDIVGVKEYNSREEFESDFENHLVDSNDSKWGFNEKKYGYILANPERITPYEAPKGGIVARELSEKRIMKSMQYADSYESKTQDKLDFETDIETAISKYANGEYVHTIDGDIAVSTNLGIVYLGGDENNPVVNRVVKIVETGIGKSGKIELRKDLEIQEIWLDAEEDIADGKNFNQNIFVANLKRVMQSFSKGRITITEYSGGNFRPFSSNGRADRERGSKNLRALERDILYRNVYNKDETDSGNQSAIAIKNAIVENTGVDSKKFSTQIETNYDELIGENKQLKKVNEKLVEDVDRLRRSLRLQGKVTKGKVLNEHQLEVAAKSILKDTGSKYQVKAMAGELKEIYGYILDNYDRDESQFNMDIIMSKCYDAASRVMESSKKANVEQKYPKEVMDAISKLNIKVGKSSELLAKTAFGDNWKKALNNRFTVSSDGMTVTEAYNSLREQFPMIPEKKSTKNRANNATIMDIVNLYDDMKEASSVVNEANLRDLTLNTAYDIYNKFWTVSSVKTVADKYDAEIKTLKAQHRTAIKELKSGIEEAKAEGRKAVEGERAKGREAVEKQRLADTIYYNNLINKIRQQRDAKYEDLREHYKQRDAKIKDANERKKLIASITDTSKDLIKWIRHPDTKKGKFVPNALQPVVIQLLESINFSSRQALGQINSDKAFTPTQKDLSFRRALVALEEMATKASTEEGMTELGFYIDFSDSFLADLKELTKRANDISSQIGRDNEYVLNEMDAEDLERLNSIVKQTKALVQNLNRRIGDVNNGAINNVGQSTIIEADAKGKKKFNTFVNKFFEYKNGLPIYVFEHLGKGASDMFREIQDGWDKFAFNVKQIIEFSEATFDGKQFKEWTEHVNEFDLLVIPNEAEAKKGAKPHNEKIKMTDAQAMSIYCLSKREHAKGHFSGGGIVIDTFKDGNKDVVQTQNVRLSDSSLQTIINSLSDEQRAVADKLQEFMNTVCSDWGNEVTMRRFGVKGFTEKNYFPISVDDNVLMANPRKNEKNLYALLNMSFTKPIDPRSTAPMKIGSIFDTFTTHTSEMAKYNSLALPVLDVIKWYNYKEKDIDGTIKTVKGSIETAYGKDAKSYIMNFLLDLNGNQESGRNDDIPKKLTRAYKTAAVAANLQVAVLQPISIFRATAVMNSKYILGAIASPQKIKHGMEMCQKYCGIAVWKNLSLFDTNVSRGIDAEIKQNATLKDKAVELSLKPAEMADEITWGAIWNACEAEVSAKSKNTGEELNKEIAERFRDIIYRTQVIDSTMTRTDVMRDGSLAIQWATAFMSEPSITMNLLQDAVIKTAYDAKNIGTAQALKKNGKVIKGALMAYVIGAAVEGIIRGGIGKWRDLDDDEAMVEKMLSQFKANLNVLNNIPWMKDIVSIFQGYNVDRMDVSSTKTLYYAFSAWTKAIDNNEISYKTIYKTAQAVSQLTGIPISNLLREIEPLWNLTVGEAIPNAKME